MTLHLILAGLVAMGMLALLYGRQSRSRGRAEVSAEGLEAAVGAAGKAGAIDEDVSRMPDADLYDELHNGGKRRLRLGASDRRE